MAERDTIYEKSFLFALRIVNLYNDLQDIKKERVMSKQILRSGTSIGANVAEAKQAESKSDFIHKMSISLKESGETKYRLRLLHAANYIDNAQYES